MHHPGIFLQQHAAVAEVYSREAGCNIGIKQPEQHDIPLQVVGAMVDYPEPANFRWLFEAVWYRPDILQKENLYLRGTF